MTTSGRVLALLAWLLGAVLLSGCARPPEIVGIDNPEIPAATVEEASRRQIFILSTRAASDEVGALYGGARGRQLGFASVTVSIPPGHQPGKIERPERLPPDPRREFAIVDPRVHADGHAFISHLDRELAARPPAQRDVLVFVHGFNTSTTDAILRIAQFVEDTGYEGVPVLFTWASAANATRYVYDLNSVLAARPMLLAAAGWLQTSRARGYDLFAHSMGAFLTMEALVQARLGGFEREMDLLNNVMLAAPDIDIDTFRAQLSYMDVSRRNLFVLISKDDVWLRLSGRISGGVERVGAADGAELARLGVTVIDLTEVERQDLGNHDKFAASPAVVRLIGRSLHQDNFRQVQRRPTLVEVLSGVPVLRVLAQ